MEKKAAVVVDKRISHLVPRFFENRRTDMARIMDLLEAGDFETISRIGHSFRGTAATFGFHELSGYGIDLQRGAKGADKAVILEAVDKILSSLEAYDSVKSDEP